MGLNDPNHDSQEYIDDKLYPIKDERKKSLRIQKIEVINNYRKK